MMIHLAAGQQLWVWLAGAVVSPGAREKLLYSAFEDLQCRLSSVLYHVGQLLCGCYRLLMRLCGAILSNDTKDL